MSDIPNRYESHLHANASAPSEPKESAARVLKRLRADTQHSVSGTLYENHDNYVAFLLELYRQSEEGEIGILHFTKGGATHTGFFNARKSLLYWLTGEGDHRVDSCRFGSFEWLLGQALIKQDLNKIIRSTTPPSHSETT